MADYNSFYSYEIGLQIAPRFDPREASEDDLR